MNRVGRSSQQHRPVDRVDTTAQAGASTNFIMSQNSRLRVQQEPAIMMGKDDNGPEIEEIVAYWSKRAREDGAGVDWSEAHKRCWRCGYEAR